MQSLIYITYIIGAQTMKRIYSLIVITALAALIPFLALAQDDQPLTKPELDKFIADTPDFINWAEKQEQLADKDIGEMAADKMIRDYLSKKDWNPERYFNVFSRVAMGVQLLQRKPIGAEEKAMIEAQIESIKKNTALSPEAKKEMIDAMNMLTGGQFGGGMVNTDKKELELIKSRQAELLRILEMGG